MERDNAYHQTNDQLKNEISSLHTAINSLKNQFQQVQQQQNMSSYKAGGVTSPPVQNTPTFQSPYHHEATPQVQNGHTTVQRNDVHHSSSPSSSPVQHNPSAHTQVKIPYRRFTKVRVQTEDLSISEATIDGHYYQDGDLWYHIFTARCKYTFPSAQVFEIQQQNESQLRNGEREQQHTTSYPQRDDVSVTSSSTHDYHSRNYNNRDPKSRDLLPTQFRIKGQNDIKNIRCPEVLRHGEKWTLQWKDYNEDPKDFYESLRARLLFYGIVLKKYMDLTREEDICGIDKSVFENYDKAYPEMSESLFTILSEFQEKWFGTNPRWDMMLHFEDKRDGFGLLKKLVQTYHPNLKDKIKCETMDKPTIEPHPTWFRYMKHYRRWVQYEENSDSQRHYTDYEHLSNIFKEIEKYDVFDAAKQKIEIVIQTVNHNSVPFPDEFKLHNIAMTIHELLPPDAQTVLPSYNASSTQPTINKVNTRSEKNKQRNKDTKDNNPSREWHDVICPACGQAGHHIDIHGCDMMAMRKKLDEYLRKKNRDFNNKAVMEIFEKHQLNKKDKRKSGKSQRNVLRRNLRAARKAYNNDEQYNNIKPKYIRMFKEENPGYDLNDPRQDHNLEIQEYDILDSEPEDEGTIEEEV